VAVTTVITGIGRLFTAGETGVVEDAALVVDGDRIGWAGRRADLPSDAAIDAEVNVEGCLVTPGLIDAHTHPVYAGQRFAELAMRSAGASYAEVAAAGGGIGATVRATRAESPDRLAADLANRLATWPAGGTTTVEAKTGYHLDRDGELAAVRMLASLAEAPGPGAPRIETTFLAAHAVPDGLTADQQAGAAAEWCGEAAAAGARHVDVFCDEGYFSVDQARRVLLAGRDAGLAPRLHADELARTGGARLAAEVGAASADHLLRVDDDDCRALAAAGVAAVLCPVTALGMGRLPPTAALRDAGTVLALGSDHNPGTSGASDMTLVVALAVAALGLSVDEALVAATAGGARALRRDHRGVVAPGALADLVAWDADHEGAFAWSWGLRPRHVWIGGVEVTPARGAPGSQARGSVSPPPADR
jgi:imidazolonepropionase